MLADTSDDIYWYVLIRFPKFNKKNEQIGHHNPQVWASYKKEDNAIERAKKLRKQKPDALVSVEQRTFALRTFDFVNDSQDMQSN